ncbi:MAG TPA: AAA family ATPase [Phycisphaerales bacterium]|nr:AAA family ATPase [Phycisphaerales bacterium]
MDELARLDHSPVIISTSPVAQGPEISRDNLLDTIDEQVRSGHHALLVEGESGDGKTVLVKAYARRHPNRALFVGVSAASKWGYDPHCLLQSIATEVHRVLGVDPPAADHLYQESDLQKLYARLARRGSSSEPVLFILDGLHEVPDEDDHIRRRLVDLIPLGLGGITAILTDSVPSRVKLGTNVKLKTWRLTKFTLDESREYLKHVVSDHRLVQELHHTFKGRPGSLAVIHRLLSAGMNPQQLLGNTEGDLGSLLEREWTSVGTVADSDLQMLGLLVYARAALTSSDVSRILRVPQKSVDSLFRRISFLHTDPATGITTIVGETMRQFVLRKTERFKQVLLDLLIQDLQDNPSVRESLSALPRYFQDAGRLQDLVTFLTPSRLGESLRNADTLRPLSETLAAGLEAAAKLKRDGDSYRFSLQTSAVAEIGSAASWDSQLTAVLALGDFDQAIQIAESVPLAKDKLLLLASVASAQRIDGRGPSDALIERIRRLLDDVADSLGPEQAVDLAGRLFVVMPDRATQLVQSAAVAGRPGGSVDWAIAQLTIFTAMAKNAAAESGGSHTDVGAAMRAHIRDPELRRFSSTISHSLSSVSARDAIAQSQTIDNARDQIYFLRHWTDQNRERPDAIEVTHAAIDLIVATTEYSPNARDVLRIARPLRFCNDQPLALRCVSRLGALLGDLAERGPTAELFRLRILLAATTYRWNREDGRTRFQEEYCAITDIKDLAIKAECLSRFLSQLSVADPEAYLESVDQLRSLAESDLRKCVELLLACTGDHEQMLSPVIAAVANTHPSLTEELLQQVNTLSRRDALRLEAIKHMLRGPATRLSLEAVIRVTRRVETSSGSSECALAVWKQIEGRPKTLEVAPDLVEGIASVCFGGRDATVRSVTAAMAYSAIRQAQLTDQDPLLSRLRELLRSSLSEIDNAWEAVDTSLEACSLLAKADAGLAKECLQTAQSIQADRLGGRSGPTWLVLAPVKLAIASLAGLMRKASDRTSDADRVLALIGYVPSAALRAQLRSELAVWFYAADRLDDCRKIVQTHVLPEIRELESKPSGLFTPCVVSAADAIFLAVPETAKAMFEKLEREYRDMAITRAVTAKLNRLPASEPYRSDEKRAARLTREDIDELIPLLRKVDSDVAAWEIVDRLTTAIIESNDTTFSSQQLATVSQQLETVASELFPKKDWIQHRGYAVLWSAAARRIKRRKLEFSDPTIAEARTIPNISDRCFMLAHLGGLANAEAGAKLLEEAAELARQIPVEVERIERLAYVAESGMRLKRAAGTSLAKEVCRLSIHCDHGDLDAVRRRVMDVAYRTDRELAGALAEAADTDPARISARVKRGAKQMKEQLKALDATKAVIDHHGDESLPPAEIERLPASTWQALASLNAGRAQAKRLEDLRPYIRIAANLPLSDAYPIMAWILANVRMRFEATPDAAKVLRPFFEASSMVAEFSAANAFPTHALRLPADSNSQNPMLVRIGQQKEAQELFERWIGEHVKKRLLICDPYFGPDDLWVLTAVLRSSPDAEVVILTSREKFPPSKPSAEEQFRTKWRELSDQDAPRTEVVVCGFADSGKLPVHDRWWLADSAGLRPGTSLSGLGSRESRLNEVDPGDLAQDRALIEEYSVRRVRKTTDGRSVLYSTFSL